MKTRKVSEDALNGVSHGGQLLSDVDNLSGAISNIKNSKNYNSNGFVGVQVNGKTVWMDETDLVGYIRQHYPNNVKSDRQMIRYDNVTISISDGSLVMPVAAAPAPAENTENSW